MFALFPLTDTDIWWHLACGREWVTTWTPVRAPVVNVHHYFQQVVYFIYGIGGAPALVAFKAVLWGMVFALFIPRKDLTPGLLVQRAAVAVVLLFVFRFQLEIRPVVFTLCFLGIYWNVLPRLFWEELSKGRFLAGAVSILLVQWIWCKFQGLYILGPLLALSVCLIGGKTRWRAKVALVALLFAVPFLHREGVLLVAYPFELLNRLLGLSPSASIFASQIAENRSPITLLIEGENFWTSLLMVASVVLGLVIASRDAWRVWISKDWSCRKILLRILTLWTTGALALVAERNFILFLPVFMCALMEMPLPKIAVPGLQSARLLSLVLLMFVMGLWCRSLLAYDRSMVAYQRVPVFASQWLKAHPHEGRLFNDDRAGGYLALMSPRDSIYIDGRFMLKTADFFGQYLRFAEEPEEFFRYADSVGVDRAVFPLKYYARWNKLMEALDENSQWNRAYQDEFFGVYERIGVGECMIVRSRRNII